MSKMPFAEGVSIATEKLRLGSSRALGYRGRQRKPGNARSRLIRRVIAEEGGMLPLDVLPGLFRLKSRTEFWNVAIAGAVLLCLTGALLFICFVGFSAWLD